MLSRQPYGPLSPSTSNRLEILDGRQLCALTCDPSAYSSSSRWVSRRRAAIVRGLTFLDLAHSAPTKDAARYLETLTGEQFRSGSTVRRQRLTQHLHFPCD